MKNSIVFLKIERSDLGKFKFVQNGIRSLEILVLMRKPRPRLKDPYIRN